MYSYFTGCLLTKYYRERSVQHKWSTWKKSIEGRDFILKYALDYLTPCGAIDDVIAECHRTVACGLRPASIPSVVETKAVVVDGPVAAETPEPDLEEVKSKFIREQMRARGLDHLLDHTPYCSSCEGCLAKSRAKKHFKGAFQRSDDKHKMMVTMDQLTLADVEGTMGLGGFKYGIVICKVLEDYWEFIPLRTLLAVEADRAFKQFCLASGCTSDNIIVHCDAHTSLIRICDNFKAPREHPPPATPVANAVIERKVGLISQGIRAYLTTAGLPNCFWPFVGHAFSINYNMNHTNDRRQKPYVDVVSTTSFQTAVPAELIFFTPATTIAAVMVRQV